MGGVYLFIDFAVALYFVLAAAFATATTVITTTSAAWWGATTSPATAWRKEQSAEEACQRMGKHMVMNRGSFLAGRRAKSGA